MRVAYAGWSRQLYLPCPSYDSVEEYADQSESEIALTKVFGSCERRRGGDARLRAPWVSLLRILAIAETHKGCGNSNDLF
jgi:hypothetical protein